MCESSLIKSQNAANCLGNGGIFTGKTPSQPIFGTPFIPDFGNPMVVLIHNVGNLSIEFTSHWVDMLEDNQNVVEKLNQWWSGCILTLSG